MTFKCLPVSGIRREIGESVNAYGVAQKPAEFIAQVEFMLFFFLSLPLFFPPSPSFPFSLPPSFLPSSGMRGVFHHTTVSSSGRGSSPLRIRQNSTDVIRKGSVWVWILLLTCYINFIEIMKQVS